ncbi:hypothetical protein [Nocardioides antri]|uniref:Uncharacterized protein n=1 Tax=Nocardioides antri TaxID=2607659 RepID=A0A5B1LU91_9ACTN|nr:hypothetical protein [Nocardioides antri]KAA1423187.1 hypothetical protein F0U47_20130 [Nocardioides antri]
MSFNNRSPIGSPSERGAALRAQQAAEAQQAHDQRRFNDMTEKSPTGIPRASLPTEDTREAANRVHRKIGEGWDLLREGRQRTDEAKRAAAGRRASDAQRAPALDNPNGVR